MTRKEQSEVMKEQPAFTKKTIKKLDKNQSRFSKIRKHFKGDANV